MFVNIAIVESCSFVIEKLCPDIFQTIPLPMVQNQSTIFFIDLLFKNFYLDSLMNHSMQICLLFKWLWLCACTCKYPVLLIMVQYKTQLEAYIVVFEVSYPPTEIRETIKETN